MAAKVKKDNWESWAKIQDSLLRVLAGIAIFMICLGIAGIVFILATDFLKGTNGSNSISSYLLLVLIGFLGMKAIEKYHKDKQKEIDRNNKTKGDKDNTRKTD